MIAIVSVLAHRGGWDELILALVPIALFAALLAIANRRAVRAQAEPLAPAEPVDPPEPTRADELHPH